MNARDLTHRLAELLRREHAALAEFLVELAEFDQRRLWLDLGHTSLFYFLHRELGLSKGAAFYRKTAAELIQRFPELVGPLRDGRLCLTSVVELAKALTPENRADVLPRFFHRSKQEAKAVSAELRPAEAAPHRDVVTAVEREARAPVRPDEPASPSDARAACCPDAGQSVHPGEPRVPPPDRTPQASIEPARREERQRDAVEPLSADLRRLHVTVSRRFLEKLEAARDALSHSCPEGTTEEILDTALDLLLAREEKRRGLVENPRPPTRAGETVHVPASAKREVWSRDGGRCQWPLASGGVCGSTRRLELDHVVPRARGGSSAPDNLRLLCAMHNALAARQVFGDEWMDGFTRRGGRPRSTPPSSRG